jgi:hypothetical protein
LEQSSFVAKKPENGGGLLELLGYRTESSLSDELGSSFFFSPFLVSRNSSVQLLITSFRLIHLGIGLLRDCVLFFLFSVDRAGKKGSFLSFLQLLFV